jgi:hypothetical protein
MKRAFPPRYGPCLHVDADPDFRELFGWDWREPEREIALDLREFAADKPTLAARASGRLAAHREAAQRACTATATASARQRRGAVLSARQMRGVSDDTAKLACDNALWRASCHE